jgi:hypothetical protein
MHQAGPDQCDTGPGEHIGLDGQVVDMDLFDTRNAKTGSDSLKV